MNDLTINKNILNKKPPINWRLFIFLIISIIHLILLLSIFYNIKFTLLFFLELIFFIYFNRSKSLIKVFLKIILITLLIFMLNIFFTDGKIITNIGFIKITYEGFIDGIKKTGLFISTIFFTSNCLKNNNDLIIKYYRNKHSKNNLLVNSIRYFFIFFESISEKYSIKKLLIKLLRIYKNKNKEIQKGNININILKIDFLIYNIIFFISFIYIFIL